MRIAAIAVLLSTTVVACGKDQAPPDAEAERVRCVSDCTRVFRECLGRASGDELRKMRCRTTLGECTGRCAKAKAGA
jgi:hypothetical protein